MAPRQNERLWSFVGLTRLWAWSLIGSGVGLVGVAAGLQATQTRGLDGRWWLMLGISMTLSLGIFYPFLGAWLGRAANPSARLPAATPLKGSVATAGRGDWRKWGILIPLTLFVGSVMMMSFLIAQLGRGGTAEGVVIGVMLAWGVVTLRDVRRIQGIEQREGRRYFASCRRPVAIAETLVWSADR